jgi:hypothetical protein
MFFLIHFSDNCAAFFASHGLWILRRDAFHLGAMSGFAIAWIACNHAVIIQEMERSFPASARQSCARWAV